MDQREKERRKEGRGEPAAASIGHPEWPDGIKPNFPGGSERFLPKATAFRRRLRERESDPNVKRRKRKQRNSFKK